MADVRDRRLAPRVVARTPFEVAARSSHASRTVWGRLMDASSGGVAFITEDDVEHGERFELSINGLDGTSYVEGVLAQVVRTRSQYGDCVAHCAFVESGLPEGWLASVAGPAG